MAHEPAKPQIHAYPLIRLMLLLFAVALTLQATSQQKLTTHSKKASSAYNDAVKSYSDGKTALALQYLSQALNRDPHFVEAYLLQGELFALEKQTQPALASYEKAASLDSVFFPPVYGLIGELHYQNGNFSAAKHFFAIARRFVPLNGKAWLQALNWELIANQADSIVNHPSASAMSFDFSGINSDGDEYINGLQIDGQALLFTRRAKAQKTDNARLDEQFYFAFIADSLVLEVLPVVIPNAGGNTGAPSLSADGRQIWFSGCGWPQGQGSCDLYRIIRKNNAWSEPISLGSNMNTAAWESQPALTPDGKELYFASNRKGGFGGSDIYKSVKLADGSWSKPINLGSAINTEKDEMAPFIHPDGKTLYFSSNGHFPSLGQSDIFVCSLDDAGRWSQPQNAGYPLNSTGNDLGIVVSADGKNAIVSSDRKNDEAGFDLFAFRLHEVSAISEAVWFTHVVVQDRETGQKLKAHYNISDLADGSLVFDDDCDDSGSFLIPLMPNKTYGLQVFMPGFLLYSAHFPPDISLQNDKNEFVVWLDPIAIGEKVTLNNVFFETGEAIIRPASFSELKRLAAFLKENPNLIIELSGHTDNTGLAATNRILSLQRAEAVKSFLVSEQINPMRIESRGYGSDRAVADNSTERGRQLNRRTEMRIKGLIK